MSETITLRVLDIDTLAREHDLPDLAERLRRAGIAVPSQADRQYVTQDDWLKFTREAIRSYAPLTRATEHPPEAIDEAADGFDEIGRRGDGTKGWGPREAALLQRNARLKQLLDQVTAFIEQHLKATWDQNLGTRTFFPPNARKFGLELRARTLFIYRVHGTAKEGIHVGSEEDFDGIVDWVQGIAN